MSGNGDRFATSKGTLNRDIQGESGGGADHSYREDSVYTNPTLNVSTSTFGEEHPDLRLRGSNDFMLVEEHKRSSTIETIKSALPWIKKKVRRTCTKKTLYKRLPILTWLPRYNGRDFLGDLVAGITVGLTVIPQSLAYSNVAGLPSEYGLYGSFLGCFIYIVLGSCKDVPVGPTAILSLLTHQAIGNGGPDYAILLSFLCGIVQITMGLFGLGFVVDFVSGPVSSGFTSAVALIIVTSQVKDVLGITTSGNTFLEQWISVFREINNTKPWDAVLGVCCIIVLLSMRLLVSVQFGVTSAKEPEGAQPSTFQKTINRILWLVGTSRNAILVIICGVIGYVFKADGEAPFALIGYIPPGLPEAKVPPFGHTNGNTTETFLDMVSNIGSGVIVVPLIALLENIAICKAFANGKPVDATQELFAIGVCNVASSFVQAYPTTGSLSRSAVNNSSGVRTPLGGLYTGLLVLIALLFFTPYFFYIPKASLAAIIIAAVVFMVEVKVVKPMWRTKKSDLIPGLGTFIACLLLPLEIGILTGIGTNLLFILYHAARPKITIEVLQSRAGVEYLMVTPDRCLIFPSVDYVRNLVTKHSLRQATPVVIDCSHVYGADYTAATVVETLTKDFAARKQLLFFYNLKPSVSSVFEGLSPKEFMVYYNEEELDEMLRTRSHFKQNGSLTV